MDFAVTERNEQLPVDIDGRFAFGSVKLQGREAHIRTN